ncbi:MAG: hypothetical protein QOG28_4523, partial [Trebonia sp.]|nr:hypothetical protein [Trebonia sp.]
RATALGTTINAITRHDPADPHTTSPDDTPETTT